MNDNQSTKVLTRSTSGECAEDNIGRVDINFSRLTVKERDTKLTY